MPNWAFGHMEIKGKKENIEEFIDLLLDYDEKKNKDKERHFARSWNNDKDNIINKYKDGKLTIITQHAWSFETCMMKNGGYYQDYKKELKKGKKTNYELVCIEDICKELNLWIIADYTEEDCGFTEYYEIDNKEDIIDEKIISIPEHLCRTCKHLYDECEDGTEDWDEIDDIVTICRKYKEE